MKRLWRLLLVIASVLIVLGLPVWLLSMHANGYAWADWTGFGRLPEDQDGKTLWDWMELLLVPIALAAGAFWLERSERASDRKIAADRRQADLETADRRSQEALLQAYLDRMDHLILEKNLRKKVDLSDSPTVDRKTELTDAVSAVRDMAQIRTVTVIRQLNTDRQNIVFQFLRDADLADFILQSASLANISLERADLSGVNLSEANLSGARLHGANLRGANLTMADLGGADLGEASLSEADLRGANLYRANLARAALVNARLGEAFLRNCRLTQANLRKAVLERANLSEADLSGADLSGARLAHAKITSDQLASVESLEGAIMPDGTKYITSSKDLTVPAG